MYLFCSIFFAGCKSRHKAIMRGYKTKKEAALQELFMKYPVGSVMEYKGMLVSGFLDTKCMRGNVC